MSQGLFRLEPDDVADDDGPVAAVTCHCSAARQVTVIRPRPRPVDALDDAVDVSTGQDELQQPPSL